MDTGKIVRFDDVRGYGFIAPDNGSEDVFVHANDLVEDKFLFTPGTPVEFEASEGDRGLKASAVRLLNRGRAGGSAPSLPAKPSVYHSDDDGLCDVLSVAEFSQEITEVIIKQVPISTGEQIIKLRHNLVELAKQHGWVEI